MQEETRAIPGVLEHMLSDPRQVRELAEHWRQTAPALVMTLARGSSAHAADYVSHLLMRRLGLPSMAMPLSQSGVYASPLTLPPTALLAFSQSGRSPDLVTAARYLSRCGGSAAAVVNTAGSPLAAVADRELLLAAGEERSVAATKSYVAMLMAGLQLVSELDHTADAGELRQSLNALPERMREALTQEWQLGVETLSGVERLLIVARGPSLAIAQEMALKLKETCGIQAEAFSSAEVRHGPMELIVPDYPVLVLAPEGAEQAGSLSFAEEMRARGARVLVVAPEGHPAADLPCVDTGHACLQPLSVIQSAYVMIEALARQLGRSPDTPIYLSKVTQTL
ncbi:SIS domain-containing protein [Salinicola aestuarinus]|uniref:SIS domain-containing protein n=1 Tax=Salinicola aestuarinus TaxID=1949082 RepID=UPI000DA140BC|nr:SIS domain-containing protein [Salinicola aestuarinus]